MFKTSQKCCPAEFQQTSYLLSLQAIISLLEHLDELDLSRIEFPQKDKNGNFRLQIARADDHYLDKYRKLSLDQINQVLLRNRQQLQRDRETAIAACLFGEHSGILPQCNCGGRFRFGAEFNTFACSGTQNLQGNFECLKVILETHFEPWDFNQNELECPFYLKLKKVNGNDWVLEEDSNFSHRHCFGQKRFTTQILKRALLSSFPRRSIFSVTPDQASICLNENRFHNVPRTTLIRALKELKEEAKELGIKENDKLLLPFLRRFTEVNPGTIAILKSIREGAVFQRVLGQPFREAKSNDYETLESLIEKQSQKLNEFDVIASKRLATIRQNLIATGNRLDFIENVLNQNKILFAQKRDSLLRAWEDRINVFMAR